MRKNKRYNRIYDCDYSVSFIDMIIELMLKIAVLFCVIATVFVTYKYLTVGNNVVGNLIDELLKPYMKFGYGVEYKLLDAVNVFGSIRLK